MSTYRKFDKYRQRADFLSDMEFGIDTPANKWIASGTGSPAVAIVAGRGLGVTTTGSANDTAFIQRGIISAATKSSPLTLVKGQKAHIVASFALAAGSIDAAGFGLGFCTAHATPFGQNDRIALLHDPAEGFRARLGATKTVLIGRLPSELAVNGQLDLEVYYDGTDNVQFFAGRTRLAKIEAGFNNSGVSTDISGALSPTFGVMNAGDANARTAVLRLLGYAVQRTAA